MTILSQEIAPLSIRYDSAIVLGKWCSMTTNWFTSNSYILCVVCHLFLRCIVGSLSKGTEENVRALIDANLIQLLLSIITDPKSDKHLMEICLCVVRSIYEHPFAPSEIINTNAATLVYLIGNTFHLLSRAELSQNVFVLFVNRFSIAREYGAVSGVCGEYFDADLSECERSKDVVPVGCYTIASSINTVTIRSPSNTGLKMFGSDVLYKSYCVWHCVCYEVSSRRTHNLTFGARCECSSFLFELQLRRSMYTRYIGLVDIAGTHAGCSNSIRTMFDLYSSIGFPVFNGCTNRIQNVALFGASLYEGFWWRYSSDSRWNTSIFSWSMFIQTHQSHSYVNVSPTFVHFQIDSELQRLAAISNQLIISLSSLLHCKAAAPRQGAFRCFASLGANDEDIRKRIIERDSIMEKVLAGLGDPSADVRLAAVRCLHSLSRSVQQLRTTFQDHLVWRPLMALSAGNPSNELLTVVTSTICNLLLEFSPAKEPMVELGAIELLCQLTQHPETALRLNGTWALMNMCFKTDEHIKTKIINSLGTDRIFQLLNDSDTSVIMKTLGLLRNLMSNPSDIENIMSGHSDQLMHMVSISVSISFRFDIHSLNRFYSWTTYSIRRIRRRSKNKPFVWSDILQPVPASLTT